MAILERSEVIGYFQATKTYTNIDLELLTLLTPMAERMVKRFLGFNVEQVSYTHFLPDRDANPEVAPLVGCVEMGSRAMRILRLPELPVRSITSIYEDATARGGQHADDFAADTLLTAGTDYWLDVNKSGISTTGFVHRVAANWPLSPRTVKVTYVAGYSEAEIDAECEDIKLAALITLGDLYSKAKEKAESGGGGAGPITSESIGNYSVSYADRSQQNLPVQAARLLESRMNWGNVI